MLDIEHNQVIYSDSFVDLVEGTTEYYDKKIEKCLKNTSIKELITGQEHHLLVAAREMIESEEAFMKHSRLIAQKLFAIARLIEEMPNANLLFIECKVNGEKMMLIIKLNYKIFN